MGKRRTIGTEEFGRIASAALREIHRRKPVEARPKGKAFPVPRWFIVHTEAGQEATADSELQRAGYMTFFAFDRVRRRRKRPGTTEYVVEWIEKPYFARYIFAALRFENDSIEAIEKCDGVSCVVRRRFSLEPYEIKTSNLDEIMERALVRFDVKGYCMMMRQMVIDPDKQITLFLNAPGKRKMFREPVAEKIA